MFVAALKMAKGKIYIFDQKKTSNKQTHRARTCNKKRNR